MFLFQRQPLLFHILFPCDIAILFFFNNIVIQTHYYQPLWTLVGAGIKPLKESAQPLEKVLTSKATLYKDKITHIEPKESYVVLSNGDKVSTFMKLIFM